ncbi:helix-turn-helix transcriptional regulator (plasmid) [Tistrella mobilis]|uniref:helix-turn-helix transcriptional regulator n=1 Tax=Tistrella mobilis TaxID=171437 RepID=UPI0035588EED
MTPSEFSALRKALGYTQAQLAEALGMGRRTIIDIEAGTTPVRVIHILALERLSLTAAVEHRDPMRATASVRREALDITALIRGEA